jgi:hypothetical protein
MNRRSSKASKKVSSKGKLQGTRKAVKPRRAATKRSTKAASKAPPNRAASFSTSHRRVTGFRAAPAATMGMHPKSKLTHAGSTPHFDVSYMTSLGQKGAALAQAILQNCERDYSTLQQIFGGLTPQRLPFIVQITSGATGASHSSCMGTDMAVGGKSGSAVDFIRSLLVAEADEVFMANFGHGWDCGASNGEGLSRVLANDLYQGVEPAGFISSNSWLNSSREDFVNNTLPDDTDYPSIGCSVLFLNWLRFQLKYSWASIVAAGAGTLAGTYNNLTGKSTAWKDFNAMVNAHFPAGHQYNLKTDNPFPV